MSNVHSCSVCQTVFELRFAYQVLRADDASYYFCSQKCHEEHLFARNRKTCSVCDERFELQYAFQQSEVDGETRYFCKTSCRDEELTAVKGRQYRMRRIAILNQKGGTGKTTTSVNLAAGLAEAGHRVLLIDLDAQGNVGVSLGLNITQKNMYHLMVEGVHPADCIIRVTDNLDAIVSNTSLAPVEEKLMGARERFKVLSHRMRDVTNYDYVVMDCAPSLSILNQNALTYADHIIIPVSCDFLSLVGVRQVLRTLKRVNEVLLHPVSILGVVPTFYDKRTKISQEAVRTLGAYFKDRVLPPIRSNTKLKEAPSHKKTIFEYDPDCNGAKDYRALVVRVTELCAALDAEERAKESAVGQAGA